ncbi:hypothetical protein BDZ89DRAFT_480067 [Hymenopellis radicata]|nr:hypothetical protein BDZ89DRAFT_480067 [Hymenopellis radicata]
MSPVFIASFSSGFISAFQRVLSAPLFNEFGITVFFHRNRSPKYSKPVETPMAVDCTHNRRSGCLWSMFPRVVAGPILRSRF